MVFWQVLQLMLFKTISLMSWSHITHASCHYNSTWGTRWGEKGSTKLLPNLLAELGKLVSSFHVKPQHFHGHMSHNPETSSPSLGFFLWLDFSRTYLGLASFPLPKLFPQLECPFFAFKYHLLLTPISNISTCPLFENFAPPPDSFKWPWACIIPKWIQLL